ncbi:MAG TPA: 3-deoxy-manno-octulosonate cytidylyltransferase [Vicinamibacterales bacterium]|nr:3-deoxy-manno-octulosonate cytidylyltransferase [Vicinamibacterales bacterium]
MPVVVPAELARFVGSSTRVVALIPARYRSTRFPGKPLAVIGGRTMIEHVYRRVERAARVNAAFVATDDDRIAGEVDRFGGIAVMTGDHHETATDRLAEVAARLDVELIVNVQGDEPLISPAAIDSAVGLMADRPDAGIGTLRQKIEDAADLDNPHVVKVVVDHQGDGLYFTRSAIPFVRAGQPRPTFWRHIGLYVYRRDFLLKLASLPPTPLERAEGLEQLRVLEHGFRISTVETDGDTIGVDTPEDLERVRQLIEAGTATTHPSTESHLT